MTNFEALTRRSLRLGAAIALAVLAPLAVATAPAQAQSTGYGDYPETAGYEGSYSYVRTLEGSATLIQGDTGNREALQLNQPVLVGDRIWVAPRGRAELVLSDRNLLRVDGGSEVIFEALAGSPDRQDRMSVLRLPQGNVQLLVVRDFLGEGLPRVDTPNVTVYPRDLGGYRITAESSDWSSVVARSGSAEVVTREGSLLVRAGEEAIVEGTQRPRQAVRQAGREDSLELWGRRLDQDARYAAAPYVDESLRYESASLSRHGSWVSVEGRHAWRPRVAAEWRPYWHGRWSHSPLGLVWVSYEPWGWVPYHYGSWDYAPGYGWVWFPGYRFAPAWVYWHWTDHYAGWVPVGYYTRYYRPHFGLHFGFRFGVYGWAGGSWSHYNHWVFSTHRFIGHRDQHRHVRGGDRFGREQRLAVPRQGLLTTDTRGITRADLQRGDGFVQRIANRRDAAGGELPDVTSFVARRQDLSEAARTRILVDRRAAVASDGSGRGVPAIAGDDRPRRASVAPDRAGRAADRTDAVERAIPRAPERGAAAAGERQAPGRSAMPAGRPETARPGEGADGSWRAPGGAARGAVSRSPEATRPAGPAGEAPQRGAVRPAERPSASAPPRLETRPAARPSAPARAPARADSGAPAERPAAAGARIETRPAERPVRTAPEPPARGAGETSSSWRDRPAVQPQGPAARSPERSQQGPPAAGRGVERASPADRPSVPRRVIEGVRSNPQSPAPARPATRPTRVEPRGEPRAQPQPRSQPQVQPQPRSQPQVQPRSEPRVQPRSAPRAQPQTRSQPQVQPRSQPQVQPRSQPQMQPRVQPRSQPQVQPRVQPRNEPRVQPRSQPQVQPRVQPRSEPRAQPRSEPRRIEQGRGPAPPPRARAPASRSQPAPRASSPPQRDSRGSAASSRGSGSSRSEGSSSGRAGRSRGKPPGS